MLVGGKFLAPQMSIKFALSLRFPSIPEVATVMHPCCPQSAPQSLGREREAGERKTTIQKGTWSCPGLQQACVEMKRNLARLSKFIALLPTTRSGEQQMHMGGYLGRRFRALWKARAGSGGEGRESRCGSALVFLTFCCSCGVALGRRSAASAGLLLFLGGGERGGGLAAHPLLLPAHRYRQGH